MKDQYHYLGVCPTTNRRLFIVTHRGMTGVLTQQVMALRIEAYSDFIGADSPVRINPMNEHIALDDTAKKAMADAAEQFLKGKE